MKLVTHCYGIETQSAAMHKGGLASNESSGPVLFYFRADALALRDWYRKSMGVKARVVKVTSTHVWEGK